jgi:hypothetical protein
MPNNLQRGWKFLRGLPQSTLAPRTCMVFRSPNTKDALSSVQKIFLLFIFYVQRGRKRQAPSS